MLDRHGGLVALSPNLLLPPGNHGRPPVPPGRKPGLAQLVPGLGLVLLGVAVATAIGALLPISALVLAVLIGAVIGNVGAVNPRTQPGMSFAAKRVLRAAVVLLGLRLSFGDLTALGPAGLAVVAVTVTVTFFGTQAIGRRLGLSRDLSLLVATGYSICGASAIAAVEGSTDADEEEVAAAIGLVTLFGSLAIFVLPVLAGPLGLNDQQFGAWAGGSVHDVAQVAATASSGGASIVATAMVVKLTRVLLLTPIVIGVNVRRNRTPAPENTAVRERGAHGSNPPLLPLFVAGFVAMVLVRSTGLVPEAVVGGARSIETMLFAAALIGLGSGVRFDRLRLLGPGPLILGLLAWVLVAATSYVGVLAFF